MPEFGGLGKALVIAGLSLVLCGFLFVFFSKIPFLGKLPGDIHIARKNFTFYFPFASCVVLSVLVSLIIWLWSKR
ncbi:DUF2905 domain-containing protein [bacterium]|nr:MAG: DUF2905 domain-containing protein [bacterium]